MGIFTLIFFNGLTNVTDVKNSANATSPYNNYLHSLLVTDKTSVFGLTVSVSFCPWLIIEITGPVLRISVGPIYLCSEILS